MNHAKMWLVVVATVVFSAVPRRRAVGFLAVHVGGSDERDLEVADSLSGSSAGGNRGAATEQAICPHGRVGAELADVYRTRMQTARRSMRVIAPDRRTSTLVGGDLDPGRLPALGSDRMPNDRDTRVGGCG